nr:MAG TPA: hypothetical protein [Caudoviricetes sp.]
MLVYLYVNIDILIAFTKMPSRGECVSNRLIKSSSLYL